MAFSNILKSFKEFVKQQKHYWLHYFKSAFECYILTIRLIFIHHKHYCINASKKFNVNLMYHLKPL